VSIFTVSSLDEEEAVNRSRSTPFMLSGTDTSFEILHGQPAGPNETLWRACLAESDLPTHYTACEYFVNRYVMARIRPPSSIKSGVSIDPAKTRDHMSAYYDAYVHWAPRRRSLPILGKEQFQEDFFATRGNRQLLLARYKGEVIAGVVLRFFPRGVVEYAGGSSLQRALYLRPNDLLGALSNGPVPKA
jgi:hypothetical protein